MDREQVGFGCLGVMFAAIVILIAVGISVSVEKERVREDNFRQDILRRLDRIGEALEKGEAK